MRSSLSAAKKICPPFFIIIIYIMLLFFVLLFFSVILNCLKPFPATFRNVNAEVLLLIFVEQSRKFLKSMLASSVKVPKTGHHMQE